VSAVIETPAGYMFASAVIVTDPIEKVAETPVGNSTTSFSNTVTEPTLAVKPTPVAGTLLPGDTASAPSPDVMAPAEVKVTGTAVPQEPFPQLDRPQPVTLDTANRPYQLSPTLGPF